MDFQNIVKWLFSQAGAGWVVAIVTLLGLVFTWLRRKKPQKVMCREVSKTSLVRINRAVREKLTMSFEGEPVENLAQFEVELSNEGTEVISQVPIEVSFDDGTRILEVSHESGSTGSVFSPAVKTEMNNLQVILPYLNPRRQHGHRVKLAIVVDGDIDNVQIAGGGEGWSLQPIFLPGMKQLKRRAWMLMASLGTFGFLLPFYARVVREYTGIPEDEVSWRAFVAYLPILALLLAFAVWMWRYWISPLSKRSAI